MSRKIVGHKIVWQEIALGIFLLLTLCATGSFFGLDLVKDGPRSGAVVHEPSGGLRVVFTSPRYPDTASTRGEGVDAWLVEAIRGAERSIDIAAYDFELQTVADALLQARRRGVTVRLVTDGDYADRPALQQLIVADVPVVMDSGTPFMHNKFIVIDRAQVWSGSWNLTHNGTHRNNNNIVILNSPALAKNYTAEFEEMFIHQQFGPTSPRNTPNPRVEVGDVLVENYFAPEDNVPQRLLELLGEAERSIHFMAFAFTDNDIARVMVDKHRAGLTVSGVMEQRNITATGANFDALRQAGIDILSDGNPYMMHHKVIIIDEAIVITGSYNFTASAAGRNDENVLIIHSADVARQYMEEFARVYRQAQDGQ